jgi:methionyl-tRNA formyltransferase
VNAFAAGSPPSGIAQDDSLATYVKRLKPEDRDLDFSRPARELWLRVRALSPKPGARTALLREEPLALGVRRAAHVEGTAPPGEVVEVSGDALRVGTGAGVLELLEVLPAGRRPMSGAAFWNGFHVVRGERLGRSS